MTDENEQATHTTNPQGLHESTCRHCGRRIVWQGNTWFPRWTHQSAEAAFMDGIHDSCHITVAAPVPSDRAS